MQHVFIIGSKGIPAQYGGFETFVEKLTYYKKSDRIQYHVACMSDCQGEIWHNNARCFQIKVPNIGPARAVYYDLKALNNCINYIKKNKIEVPVIYILACRIGPFLGTYRQIIKKYDGRIYVNPDGHEWMRGKWSAPIKRYWKISERYMIKNADLVICDSKQIELYIQKEYEKYNPKTIFIPYGAENEPSSLKDDSEELIDWYHRYNIVPKGYYLLVGRFVPENNYLTIIREFCSSDTKRDLIIITKTDNSKLLEQIQSTTDCEKDSRIKFVGTVYNQELLRKIRENAYAYIHGHEVGGTNPSLLEALATTPLNLLLDVGFNREVGGSGALYWNKAKQNLAGLIADIEQYSIEDIEKYREKAKERICKIYNWDTVIVDYEKVFCGKIE